ncbi:MAG: glycogen debranching enzyme GlgX, partial [Gammaproteobacteria bacterium]|nr:glycogen debranching enzyme GlgX [Gammaproteobacteria bacterium]
QQLVLDSLRYWGDDLGVDGFRFDLAPILARRSDGFFRQHDFFDAIAEDPALRNKKMIAEPWDIGPGGYQLGNFPPPWAEWNDQYRDAIRRFWRGDHNSATFTRRLHGSADIFEASGRGPIASINLIAAHDGFTTYDVVTYEHKHNEANGEHNRDGHNHNFTRNYGVEGETDDPAINALRRRQRLNLLATLLLSQGTPMLLAGDEFGHTQHGNNNAYAQDNETTWLDWSRRELDPDFTDQVRKLIALRRELPLLRQERFLHGRKKNLAGQPNIEWLRPDGNTMKAHDWPHATAFALILRHTVNASRQQVPAVALLFNAGSVEVEFALPVVDDNGQWIARFDSGETATAKAAATLGNLCCACWAFDRRASADMRYA